MTDYYVSNTRNTSTTYDGSSWTAAWPSISAALTGTPYSGGTAGTAGSKALGAGDRLFISANHSEGSSSAAFAFAFPGTITSPNYIYVVSETAGSPPGVADLVPMPTSSSTTTVTGGSAACTITGSIYMYGMKVVIGTTHNLLIGPTQTNYRVIIDNFYVSTVLSATVPLTFGQSPSSYFGEMVFNNITVKFGATAPTNGIGLIKNCIIRGFSFDPSSSIPTSTFNAAGGVNVTLERCDFSPISSGKSLFLQQTVSNAANFLVKDCNPPVGNFGSGTPVFGVRTAMVRSDSTSNFRSYRVDDINYSGTLTVDNKVYRTNGVTDGTTAFSHRLAQTVAASIFTPYISFAMAEWNTTIGSSVNVTLEGLYITTATGLSIPKNNQFWISADYIGNTGGVQSSISGGVKSYIDTPVSLTSSSASWNATLAPRNSTLNLGGLYKYSTGGQVYYALSSTSTPQTASAEPSLVSDGQSLLDGTYTMIACYRFNQTIVLQNPFPAAPGIVYVTYRAAMPSTVLYVDPLITFS